MKAGLRKAAALGLALLMGASVSAWADHHGKGLAYVTNQDKGVSVISLETFAVVGTIDVEANEPRGIGVTRDGKYLVTANRESGDVSVIDTATRKIVKHIPIGMNPEFVRVFGDFAYGHL